MQDSEQLSGMIWPVRLRGEPLEGARARPDRTVCGEAAAAAAGLYVFFVRRGTRCKAHLLLTGWRHFSCALFCCVYVLSYVVLRREAWCFGAKLGIEPFLARAR